MFDYIKGKSLTKTILIYLLLIGLLPLSFFGLVAIITSNNVLKNQTLNFHQQLLEQKMQYINHVMDDIESLAANLSGLDEIKEALEYDVNMSNYEKLATQAKIGYILSGYSNLKGLISIDLFSESGQHFHVGETLNTLNIDDKLKDKLFENIKKSEEYMFWSGIEDNINKNSRYKKVIIAGKDIRRISEDKDNEIKSVGIVVISYNPEIFYDDFLEYEKIQGYSIIIDNYKRILYHKDKNFIGKEFSGVTYKKMLKDKGNFETYLDDDKMLVIYSKTNKGNWTIGSFIKIKSIISKTLILNIILAILLLVLIFTIIFFVYKIFIKVVMPIRDVTKTFKYLQEGNLENPKRFKFKSDNEIGVLGNLFNSFIDAREDITLQKKLERKLNEQNLKLQETLEKLKLTQMQMLQKEKLAGIGQLAAGVAHEINNPLGFVSSNFEIIKKYVGRYETIIFEIEKDIEKLEKSDSKNKFALIWNKLKISYVIEDMKEILTDTNDGIERISSIVEGLKSFSRINSLEERSLFNLNEGIRKTLLITRNELKYNCIVEFKENDIPQIKVNGGQINQVMLNIFINASHAIKKKFENEKGILKIETYSDKNFVYCRIEDNGCGMNEEVKSRIYEPFFTTKSEGEGTGLGLGIVFDIIVNKHNGQINLDSTENIGSTFLITLPIE
ncbi:MAG: ATP-binding protein [Clostridiales bacterium]